MATEDRITGVVAPIALFDDLASLAGAYESFRLMAVAEDPHSHIHIVLDQLNKRLQYIVDQLDSMGLVS
jgi:hypothetical protein